MQTTTADVTVSARAATSGKKRSAPLEPQVADRLLDLLCTDNEFRRLFKKSPEDALRHLGCSLPEGTRLECLSAGRLASKNEVAIARDALRTYLTSRLAPTNPHCFEAGKVAATTRRK